MGIYWDLIVLYLFTIRAVNFAKTLTVFALSGNSFAIIIWKVAIAILS